MRQNFAKGVLYTENMSVMSSYIEYFRYKTMKSLPVSFFKSSQRIYNLIYIEFVYDEVYFYCKDRKFVHIYTQSYWDKDVFMLKVSLPALEGYTHIAACGGEVASIASDMRIKF